MKPRLTLTFFSFVILFGVGRLIADATNVAPTKPLNLHSKLADAMELYRQATAAEAQLQQIVSKPAESFSQQDISKGYTLVEQIAWQSSSLLQYYEPIGNELNLRIQAPRWHVASAIELFVKTPKGADYRRKVMENLQSPKAMAAKQKAIDQIRKSLQQENYVEAEKLLAATYLSLWPFTAFLAPQERGIILLPIEEKISGDVKSGMIRIRRETMEKAFVANDRDWTGRREAFMQSIGTAASEISGKGTIVVNGKPMAGPVAINEILKQWGLLHQSLQQLSTLDLALHSTIQDRWNSEAKGLTTAIEKTTSDVIEAEASAAPPPIAKERYIQYLNVLGNVIGHVDDWKPETTFSGPLSKLASRGDIAAPVAGYGRVCAELLRWRGKVASAQRSTLQTGFAPLAPELRKRLTSRKEYEGLYQEVTTTQYLPNLHHSTYAVTPHVIEQMMKLKVFAPGVVRLDQDATFFMTRYHEGVYGLLPPNMRATTGLAGLMNDLMVDADHPPLSLLSAAAIGSASRGEFDAVGGEVAGLELSGFVTRFITLPASAGPLVSLGKVAIQNDGNTSSSENRLAWLTLQFKIMPAWVAHRYFVSNVAMDAASSSTGTKNVPANAAPPTKPETGQPEAAPSESPSLDPGAVPSLVP